MIRTMKILYIGCFVTPSQERILLSNKTKITAATTSFQRAFLSGFKTAELKPDIINAADIGSWPKRSKQVCMYGSTENLYGMICENVHYINISLYKQFSIYKSLLSAGIKWVKRNDNEDILIVVYSLIYPYLKAAVDIKKIFPNVRVCCIVLDLPEFFCDNCSYMSKLFDDTPKVYKCCELIDSFVLLTEQMRIPLKVGRRPWLLMEGLYKPVEQLSIEKQERTLLYTGKLDSRFGIRDLLKAFQAIEYDDVQLWICGDGTDREYVKKIACIDKRIKYFGMLNQTEVFELQKKASLLINPRKPEGEYTKYSFPSKTMEYMASGTPTLMYQLPGMPDDYMPYVILFRNSSEKEMIITITEWLNKPQVELDAFGASARNFIMENKTADKQIGRFLNFIIDNYGG